MNKRPYSQIELEDIARLREIGDDDIDLSDIPETTDEQWKNPRRPAYALKQEQPVDILIDGRVAHWFQARSEGQPVEVEINRVLRNYVSEQQRRAG